MKSHETVTPPHEHLFEYLEIDWGVFAWICKCGEADAWDQCETAEPPASRLWDAVRRTILYYCSCPTVRTHR